MTDYLVVCAWCGDTIRTVGEPPKNNPPVSHGMCAACERRDIEDNHDAISAVLRARKLGPAAD